MYEQINLRMQLFKQKKLILITKLKKNPMIAEVEIIKNKIY